MLPGLFDEFISTANVTGSAKTDLSMHSDTYVNSEGLVDFVMSQLRK